MTDYIDHADLPDGEHLALVRWSDGVEAPRFVNRNGYRLITASHVTEWWEPSSTGPVRWEPSSARIVALLHRADECPGGGWEPAEFGDTYEPPEPKPEPEPEPEWRVGQTVNTYEDLRRLPEGTVITRDADGRRRTIETRGGVLGAWDHEGGIMLLGESGGDSFAGATPKYTIARLPVATEARAHIGAAPAAECRAAASKLRELAQRATPGPWRLGSDRWAALVADRKHPDRMVGGGWEWNDAYGGCLVAESLMRPDREYFAAMHPLVGAALAGLLDEVAGHAESNDEYGGYPPESVITGYAPALRIARLINGSAP